jgi:hypothetical protein
MCSCSQKANSSMLINSAPLSVSIPNSGKGRRSWARLRAATTASWPRWRSGRHSVQPVAISVRVRVQRNEPSVLVPQWATRSASMKPGLVSFQSLKVRTGICFLSSVPDLVVEMPCFSCLRYGLRIRSAVAGLIARRWLRCSSLR